MAGTVREEAVKLKRNIENLYTTTVERLSLPLEESGAIVTCEPVEGYPLDVAWSGKNLFDKSESKLQPISFIVNGNAIEYWGYELILEPGKYVMKAYQASTYKEGYLYGAVCNIDSNERELVWSPVAGATIEEKPVTFTEQKKVYIYYAGAKIADGATKEAAILWFSYFDIQIEKGNVATAYEPYAETATITRCGKNLLDLSEEKVKVVNYIDANGAQSSDFWGVEIILPPGTYTIKATETGTTATDYIYGQANDLSRTKHLGSLSAVAGKPITRTATFTEWVRLYVYDSSVLIANGNTKKRAMDIFNRYNIQLEVGNTATAFEPYTAETFAPGDTLPAWPGVNTIYADTGAVTVTGRADPIAIINKLQAASV